MDIEQLLACKSEKELCDLLKDKGYGEGDSVEALLTSHSEALWKYLKSTAPDFDIFLPFLIQNDAHNYKVILKGTMADREYDALLVTPCTVELPAMRTAIEKRLPNLLPEWLSKFADKAYEALAHTGDARLSDAYIDRAVMLEMLRLSEKSGSAFLRDYFRNVVFYSDIKTALRSARTGANREYLKRALIRVEGFRSTASTTAGAQWRRSRNLPRRLSAGWTTASPLSARSAASASARARNRCWATTSAVR